MSSVDCIDAEAVWTTMERVAQWWAEARDGLKKLAMIPY